MMACGLSQSASDQLTDAFIKRAYKLAFELGREFDWFLDKSNPTGDLKQWRNEVIKYISH